jgi:hypothetical protein
MQLNVRCFTIFYGAGMTQKLNTLQATKGEVNSALAVSSTQAPLAAPLIATPNRPAGYQSEGYFSSDQDEDLRNRSGFFVRKLKNLDKGERSYISN